VCLSLHDLCLCCSCVFNDLSSILFNIVKIIALLHQLNLGFLLYLSQIMHHFLYKVKVLLVFRDNVVLELGLILKLYLLFVFLLKHLGLLVDLGMGILATAVLTIVLFGGGASTRTKLNKETLLVCHLLRKNLEFLGDRSKAGLESIIFVFQGILLSIWHLERAELVNLAFQILDLCRIIEHFLVQLRSVLLVVVICAEYFQILVEAHGLALDLSETGFDAL